MPKVTRETGRQSRGCTCKGYDYDACSQQSRHAGLFCPPSDVRCKHQYVIRVNSHSNAGNGATADTPFNWTNFDAIISIHWWAPPIGFKGVNYRSNWPYGTVLAAEVTPPYNSDSSLPRSRRLLRFLSYCAHFLLLAFFGPKRGPEYSCPCRWKTFLPKGLSLWQIECRYIRW